MEVLNHTSHHKGIVVDGGSDDKDGFYGEISGETWDFCGLLEKTIFYDSPPFNGNQEDYQELIGKLVKKSEGLFAQIRPVEAISWEESRLLGEAGFIREDHLSAIIPISDPDSMLKAMERDKRKGIRKARETFKLQVVESKSGKDLEQFYAVLKALYRKKHHPLKPVAYFENLLQGMPVGAVKLLVCKDSAGFVAGQLALMSQDRITALYTATASDQLHKHGGDLLIWHMLESGYEKNKSVFDFGGGGNPNKGYQPREYKKRFGTIFSNVGRYTLPLSPLYKYAKAVYDKLVIR